jgi:hypothetical protein
LSVFPKYSDRFFGIFDRNNYCRRSRTASNPDCVSSKLEENGEAGGGVVVVSGRRRGARHGSGERIVDAVDWV